MVEAIYLIAESSSIKILNDTVSELHIFSALLYYANYSAYEQKKFIFGKNSLLAME